MTFHLPSNITITIDISKLLRIRVQHDLTIIAERFSSHVDEAHLYVEEALSFMMDSPDKSVERNRNNEEKRTNDDLVSPPHGGAPSTTVYHSTKDRRYFQWILVLDKKSKIGE